MGDLAPTDKVMQEQKVMKTNYQLKKKKKINYF